MEKENSALFDNSDNISSADDNIEINQNGISGDEPRGNNELDINKARERTFNKELGDLVTKIRANETAEKDETTAFKEITEDELLKMFHKLYYKSIHLAGLSNISAVFNPFELYKESSSEDLLDLINKKMLNLSLPEYSILSYNLKKKSYAAYCNYMNGLDENNIILDTSEELYTGIMESKNGFILEPDAIEKNSFLKKRFMPGNAYYFISCFRFFKDFYSNMDLDKIDDFNNYLLPIIMIRLKENPGEHRKKIIFNEIRDRLTIYFFLLQRKIQIEFQNIHFDNLHSTFDFLDYAYQSHNTHKDCVCAVIKCKNYVNAESLFILKYLQIKLRGKLAGKTITSRIEKDKLLIFILRSKRKNLDEILDDFNKLYGNLFQVEMFMNEENNAGFFLLQDIKEHLVK